MRRLAVVVLAGVVAAGCGDNGVVRVSDTPEGRGYVDALMESYGPAATLDEQGTRCMAEGFVDLVGLDVLRQVAVTSDDGTPSFDGTGEWSIPGFRPTQLQADQMVDIVMGCVDWGNYMAVMARGDELMGNIPAEKVECMGDELAQNETYHAVMARALAAGPETSYLDEVSPDDEAMMGPMTEIFETCGIELEDFLGQ